MRRSPVIGTTKIVLAGLAEVKSRLITLISLQGLIKINHIFKVSNLKLPTNVQNKTDTYKVIQDVIDEYTKDPEKCTLVRKIIFPGLQFCSALNREVEEKNPDNTGEEMVENIYGYQNKYIMGNLSPQTKSEIRVSLTENTRNSWIKYNEKDPVLMFRKKFANQRIRPSIKFNVEGLNVDERYVMVLDLINDGQNHRAVKNESGCSIKVNKKIYLFQFKFLQKASPSQKRNS